jgi:tetratricopeptide (TPR) repeat protein
MVREGTSLKTRAGIWLLVTLLGFSLALPARAEKLQLPAEAREGLQLIFRGEPGRAVEIARRIQQARPEHPIGYLLEANAMWWTFYCEACEIRWNMVDAWRRAKLPADDAYFKVADRAIQLAENALKTNETAELHLYAGSGWALRARLHGLRDERMATARTGVKARAHFLRALELDPDFADAYTGIGLYNYYADALSPFVKFLRWFMGIPGGSKKEGVRQLEMGMKGELTGIEAQFYLAKCLRNYDQKYERAIELMQGLVERFPQNPIFHLLLGDMQAKLSRNAQAAVSYRAAEKAANNGNGSLCARRIRLVVQAALKSVM